MKVKIYGLGWVGRSMQQLFPDALIHDPGLNLINEEVADIAFVCVPTPCPSEGRLDTSIVKQVVKDAKEPLIVVRSTVNPGDCDSMSIEFTKRIVFQPEYLGETPAHPLLDPKTRPFMILGGNSSDIRKVIEVYQNVYNANMTIRKVSRKEAEVIKLSENRAISYKVAQCQELFDACEKDPQVDYYTIRDAVYGDDPRMNLWWTFIYPDKRGFNSKCIPKDVYAWCAWAESIGANTEVTRSLLNRNKELLKLNKE